MYSPKINEDLIPILYKLARQELKPMTALVDEILRAEIGKRNGRNHSSKSEPITKEVKKTTED